MKIEELRYKIYEFLLETNDCSEEDLDWMKDRFFEIAYWLESK